MKKTLLVLPAAATVLIALTACGGGGGGGATPAAPPSMADCMLGDWSSDPQDIANGIIDELTVAGLTVNSAVGTGSETAKITRTNLTMTDDLEFTFELPEMTLVQDQVGSVSSEWSVADSTLTFQNFDDTDYAITSHAIINGVEQASPLPTTGSSPQNIPTAVTCDGDTMTMQPEDSDLVTHWVRQ